MRVCRALTLTYLVLVGLAVLTPTGLLIIAIKGEAGVWLQGGPSLAVLPPVVVGDVVLNILAYIPLALLLCLGWPRIRPWMWGCACTLVSAAAETAQLLPMLHRRAYLPNVIENGLGAFIGVWIAAGVLSRQRAKQKTPAPEPERVLTPR